MFHVRSAVLAVGVLFAGAAAARADDARDIIDKAVKAHGGQANLDKFQATTITFKGKFYGIGDGIPISGDIITFGPDKQKADLVIEADGMTIPIVIVFDGKKGWSKIDKDTKEMDGDEIAEIKEQAYASWVMTLAPLKDKQFKLSTIGEEKVNNKPAVGVKVASKGHRDVDLYFDKETGMLVKTQTTVKDDASGLEVTEENFPSEYKDVQGTKQATKFVVKREGKMYLEGEAKEIKLSDKLDPSVFAKP